MLPSGTTLLRRHDFGPSLSARNSSQTSTATENVQVGEMQMDLASSTDTRTLPARHRSIRSRDQSHFDEYLPMNSVELVPLGTDSQDDRDPSESQTFRHSFLKAQLRSCWWWLEIAAVAISIACMMAAITVLANFNNTRLSDWSLSLQPNTIISILVTVAKSAMLFSVSTCLSQLKWRHFQARPAGRPLGHLQDFDEASRGPLGSLIFLKNHRLAAFTPFTLALITVASLAIDPMAQEVLKYPTKESPLHNVTGGIGQACSYMLKPDDRDHVHWSSSSITAPMPHQAQLLDSIIGAEFEPKFDCPSPATKCSWDKFTSLAVCGTFINVTDMVSTNCTSLDSPTNQSVEAIIAQGYHIEKFANLTCNFSVSDMGTEPLRMNWYTAHVNITGEGPGTWDCGHYDMLDAKVEGSWNPLSRHNEFLGLYAKLLIVRALDDGILRNISDVGNYSSTMWELPPRTEFLQASWHFCEHVYSNVSVDLGVLNAGNVIKNPLNLVSWDEMLKGTDSDFTFHSNVTGINYTVGHSNGEWSASSLSELFSVHLGGNPTSDGTRPTYNLSDSNVLFCSLGDNPIQGAEHEFSSPSEVMKSLTYYLRITDIGKLTKYVANALTMRIRNDTMRGNSNLTMLPGNAFTNEAYITVQWPWMILPILEIVLAAAALAVTIVLTRQQALLKGSTLPLLMQRIEGWSSEETRVGQLDTKERLQDRVKGMIARLDEGQDGELFFKRE